MDIKLLIGTEQADFSERFNVLFSIGDIRDLSYGSCNKTYTLNLPLTNTNKRLLKYISQPAVRTEVTAIGRLYIGELLVIQGSIRITGYTEYDAKIIISSDEWIDELKNKKLTELDLSASDHALTHANVQNSWSAAYPVYRYPLIDFGALASGETGATAKWLPNDFIPMIRVVDLLTMILAPYTISSAWIATAAIKDLYILAREIIAPSSFIEGKDLDVSETAASDNRNTVSVPAGGNATAALSNYMIRLMTETTDEAGAWSVTTYTVPETGTYRLVATILTYSNSNYAGFTETAGSFQVDMLQTGSASRTLATASAARIPIAGTYTLDSGFVHMVAGDVVQIRLNASSTCSNATPGPINLTIGLTGASTLELIWSNANRHSGVNKNISLEEMLPDMTQVDFVKAIRDIYNLRFWMDKSKGVLYIEPWDSFISSTVIDITPYIDFSNIQADLISPNYKKNIILRWKTDSSDKAYEEYLKTNADINEKTITLTSQYVEEGIETRESAFSTIIKGYSKTLGNWLLELPTIWAEVLTSLPVVFNRLTNFNTRLVEWKGLTAGLSWNYDGDSLATYPKIDGIDFETVYSTNWQKLFHYIDKGKIYTIRMKINPLMIGQFFTVVNTASSEAFRPTYKITIGGSDHYFFLQRLTTDGETAELELIYKV